MIDHETRKQLADAVRSYLNEEMSAFQFDDTLQELAGQTEDTTASEIVDLLWCFYDDLKDHKVVATKESWDFFHRVLLLLESDGELEITTIRRWSVRQLVAAGAVAAFMIVAVRLGWGWHLLAVAIPFGLASILLSFWKSKVTPKPSPKETALLPFASVAELLFVRRRVASFSKRPYPASLQSRRIRDPIVEKLMWLPSIMMWLMFGPVVLLFQAMPETDKKMGVRVP